MSGDWTHQIEIVIPGRPVGAGRPRVVRGGAHTYMPRGSVAWEHGAVLIARQAWGNREPLDEPVAVEVVQVQPRPKRLQRRKDPRGRVPAPRGKPDLDNVIKLAVDSLVKAGVLVDDTRVVRITGSKWHAAIGAQPCVELVVRW